MTDLSHIPQVLVDAREQGNWAPQATIVFATRTVTIRRASADEIEVLYDDGTTGILNAADIESIEING